MSEAAMRALTAGDPIRHVGPFQLRFGTVTHAGPFGIALYWRTGHATAWFCFCKSAQLESP